MVAGMATSMITYTEMKVMMLITMKIITTSIILIIIIKNNGDDVIRRSCIEPSRPQNVCSMYEKIFLDFMIVVVTWTRFESSNRNVVLATVIWAVGMERE